MSPSARPQPRRRRSAGADGIFASEVSGRMMRRLAKGSPASPPSSLPQSHPPSASAHPTCSTGGSSLRSNSRLSAGSRQKRPQPAAQPQYAAPDLEREKKWRTQNTNTDRGSRTEGAGEIKPTFPLASLGYSAPLTLHSAIWERWDATRPMNNIIKD